MGMIYNWLDANTIVFNKGKGRWSVQGRSAGRKGSPYHTGTQCGGEEASSLGDKFLGRHLQLQWDLGRAGVLRAEQAPIPTAALLWAHLPDAAEHSGVALSLAFPPRAASTPEAAGPG